MSKKQLYNTNFYLDKLETEIMKEMREDINNPKIPALIAEREAIKARLHDLSVEVY